MFKLGIISRHCLPVGPDSKGEKHAKNYVLKLSNQDFIHAYISSLVWNVLERRKVNKTTILHVCGNQAHSWRVCEIFDDQQWVHRTCLYVQHLDVLLLIAFSAIVKLYNCDSSTLYLKLFKKSNSYCGIGYQVCWKICTNETILYWPIVIYCS